MTAGVVPPRSPEGECLEFRALRLTCSVQSLVFHEVRLVPHPEATPDEGCCDFRRAARAGVICEIKA